MILVEFRIKFMLIKYFSLFPSDLIVNFIFFSPFCVCMSQCKNAFIVSEKCPFQYERKLFKGIIFKR